MIKEELEPSSEFSAGTEEPPPLSSRRATAAAMPSQAEEEPALLDNSITKLEEQINRQKQSVEATIENRVRQ